MLHGGDGDPSRPCVRKVGSLSITKVLTAYTGPILQQDSVCCQHLQDYCGLIHNAFHSNVPGLSIT